MTPKEKAMELFNSYEYINKHINKFDTTFHSKMCALIAVDEIIEATSIKYEFRDAELFYAGKKPLQYWLDVKKEIENL